MLAQSVGTVCGKCRLGQYVCDGRDSLTCDGDDGPTATAPARVIDDLEDGDEFVRGDSGLTGDWHTLGDESGGTLIPALGVPLRPAAGGACGSSYSVRVQGSGFRYWGAGLAVSLDADGDAVDISEHSGFSVALVGTATEDVILSVATLATTQVSEGGTCNTAACNDHFNVRLPLTTTWTTHRIAFDGLSQTGWGTEVAFRASEVLYIQFSFGPDATFDISVDDLAF